MDKDTSVLTDPDGTKTVYIFLPYYKRGNLQDNINANNINKTFFPEKDLLEFFLKVCYALKVLHNHHELLPPASETAAEQQEHDDDHLVPYGKRTQSGGLLLHHYDFIDTMVPY